MFLVGIFRMEILDFLFQNDFASQPVSLMHRSK